MVGVVVRRTADVLVDERPCIDVVHDEVQPPVVVQIGVRRAVREARVGQPPGDRLVGEGEVAVVAEDVVGLRKRPQPVEKIKPDPARVDTASGCLDREHGGLVVQVDDCLRISVADENVLVAIVVEVGEQRAPAPVGVCDAGEATHLAEDHVSVRRDAVAHLQ